MTDTAAPTWYVEDDGIVERPDSPLARSRRTTELTLVIMAALITGAAYTVTALGTNAEIPPGIVFFVAILMGLLLCAHIVVRLVARGADGTLLPLAALLHGIGFVMITRLDDELAGLQATWSLVAIVAFVATLLVVQRASDLARYSWLFFFVGAFLLLLPMVPGLGVNINGARIWVSLGPINFQPGEFAKVALAIFFAAYLAERRELIAASTWKIGPLRLPEPRYIAPILVAWGFAVVVMVGQRDLGSSLLFFTLFVVMMWVATERLGYLLIGVAMFAGAAYFSWTQFGHVQTRVDIWLDPWADPLDNGYQIVQSLYGLADGGSDRHRSRARQPRPGARSPERLHLRGDRRGVGPDRRDGGADGLRADRRRRAADRPAHRPHLREAARRRPHHDRRRAGVHHHRRRHQGGPADRHHPAVRQLRRVVAASPTTSCSHS